MSNHRQYRISPICPDCKEEHQSWTVSLTDEEQKILDSYYASFDKTHSNHSDLAILLEELNTKPLVIHRTLKCCVCGNVFEATATVFRGNEA